MQAADYRNPKYLSKLSASILMCLSPSTHEVSRCDSLLEISHCSVPAAADPAQSADPSMLFPRRCSSDGKSCYVFGKIIKSRSDSWNFPLRELLELVLGPSRKKCEQRDLADELSLRYAGATARCPLSPFQLRVKSRPCPARHLPCAHLIQITSPSSGLGQSAPLAQFSLIVRGKTKGRQRGEYAEECARMCDWVVGESQKSTHSVSGSAQLSVSAGVSLGLVVGRLAASQGGWLAGWLAGRLASELEC